MTLEPGISGIVSPHSHSAIRLHAASASVRKIVLARLKLVVSRPLLNRQYKAANNADYDLIVGFLPVQDYIARKSIQHAVNSSFCTPGRNRPSDFFFRAHSLRGVGRSGNRGDAIFV